MKSIEDKILFGLVITTLVLFVAFIFACGIKSVFFEEKEGNMKEYTVKLTEKELQTIICALQIAEDNADDIDAYDVEFDGKKYTHSEFEEDCNDYREWLAGLKPKEVNNGL